MTFLGSMRPADLEGKAAIAKITVELGSTVLQGDGSLAERVLSHAHAAPTEALRAPLLALAARLESIERSDDPDRSSILAAIEKAGRLSCEYYACGTCDSGQAQVCCYYDGGKPPVCWCEEC